MTLRTIIVLLMSLVCGTSAAVGVNQLLAQGKKKEPVIETTPIIVAAVNVPRGAILRPEVLKTQAWPTKLVPPGVLVEMDQAVDMGRSRHWWRANPFWKQRSRPTAWEQQH